MGELLTVVAEIKAKPGKEDELRRELLGLIDTTRKEDGCIQYDLHVSTADPGRFVFYENWISKDHLDRHLAAPHLQRFIGLVADLAESPRIETYRRIG